MFIENGGLKITQDFMTQQEQMEHTERLIYIELSKHITVTWNWTNPYLYLSLLLCIVCSHRRSTYLYVCSRLLFFISFLIMKRHKLELSMKVLFYNLFEIRLSAWFHKT